MKLIKINQDQSSVYPYSIEKLKEDYPNTSFPDEFTSDLLAEYNVFFVNVVPYVSDHTKNYTEGTPSFTNGQYYQNWIVSDASQAEINERVSNQWANVRQERNKYLQECDWTQLRDAPFPENKRGEWVIYRQSLRDVTTQSNPFNIVWPVKPQ